MIVDVQLTALLQLLGCPVPSVVALLLHSVKQLFGAQWPPDEAALLAVLQQLPVRWPDAVDVLSQMLRCNSQRGHAAMGDICS